MGIEPWIDLVVRYQTLLFRPSSPAVRLELARLRRALNPETFERRYRPHAWSLVARLRHAGTESACRVQTVDTNRFVVLDESHVDLPMGASVALVVELRGGAERVDFPCHVSHRVANSARMGLTIIGAPLVMRRPRSIPELDRPRLLHAV